MLFDEVTPEVPVQQWGLSLPYRERTLGAYDTEPCALARGRKVRAVSGFHERTVKRLACRGRALARGRSCSVAVATALPAPLPEGPYFVAFSSSLAFFRHSFAGSS